MITVLFKDGFDYGEASGRLWQWDYGQILRIQGLDLPTAAEIHFSLQQSGGEAITRIGTTRNGVTDVVISDNLLEGNQTQPYYIHVWVYLTDDVSGQTARTAQVWVNTRSKPEAFESPEDAELFREAIAAVNEAAERAETAGGEAGAAKEAAETAQAKSETAALEAQKAQAGAEAVTGEAEGYKTQAAKSAAEAVLSEAAAKESEDRAKDYAASAEASANASHWDAKQTAADRAQTGQDATWTAQNRIATAQDRQAVAADREAVAQDKADVDLAATQALTDISNAKSTSVLAVSAEGVSQVKAVTDAGATQVKAVSDEGAGQVQAVQAEGTAQIQAVQDAAIEIIDDREQITANKTDIAALTDRVGVCAPGVVLEASGTGRVIVTDAADAPVVDLGIKGRSEQVVTTGAQLLDLGVVEDINASGATVSIFDGGYTISGTGALTASIEKRYRTDIKKLLKPGNLTLKSTISIPRIYITVRNKSTQLLSLYGNNTGQITQEMLDDENIYIEVMFFGSKDTIITPGTYYPMLYQDGDGTWEPYTGGQPSPSPDYPQPIISTGTVTTGVQLLPPDNIYSVFLTSADGSRSNDNNYRTVWLSLPAGTYTLSVTGGAVIVKTVIDGILNNSSANIADGAGYTCTLTQDGSLGISFRKQDSSNYVTDPQIMLNAGSATKPWEPYTGGKPSPSPEYPQPLEVTVTGAQLMDTSKMARTHNDVVFSFREDGSILVTGNTLEKLAHSIVVSINLPPGTYYVSGSVPIADTKIFVKAKKWYSDDKSNVINDTAFTVDGTETKIEYFIYIYRGLSDINEIVYPMLNAGPTALPYQPYQSKTAAIQLTTPLHGIGDVRDEITMTKRIDRCVELTFDGSEDWKAYENPAYYGFYLADCLPNEMYRRTGLCNQMIVDIVATNNTNRLWLGAKNRNVYAVKNNFYDAEAADKGLSAWKTHLAAHPLRIVTYLDTPIETDLDADAIAALADLTTYKSTTHLDVAAGGPEPDITMEYIADTKTYIANEHARMQAEFDEQIASILSLLPAETQAAMINNETNNLLAESEV